MRCPFWLTCSRRLYHRMRPAGWPAPPRSAPAPADTLCCHSCVRSFGSGMATGPGIGWSPARLCA